MVIEDLADARILVEVSAKLSFVEAARALGMPPATVSRRLMRMEERAGLRLFERTTRSVSTTEAGALLTDHAARMLAEAEASELSLSSMRDEAVGAVRITAPTIFGQALLGPVVAAFLNAQPRCSLHVDLADRQVGLAEEGFDAAIRVGPVVDEYLVARPLGFVRARLYRRAGAGDVDLEDLAGAPLAMLHQGDRPELPLTSPEGSIRTFGVGPRLVCMNPWLLRHTTLSSDLISVLPDIVAEDDLREGRLRTVLDGWLAREVPVNLVYRSQGLMRPAVREFIEVAALTVPRLLSERSKDDGGQ
ncbi:MAG: LysR substrate-binding domain-containing protein [Pseudomonadota bacterium]